MTKQTISVTRALVELKRFDQRIVQVLSGGVFLNRTVGRGNFKKVVNSQDSVELTTQKIRASYDKIDQLIKNRAALKAAIVLSNATTKVKVLGQEMTVAEAIELKTSVVSRQQYLQVLRSNLTTFKNAVEVDNTKLQAKIDTSLNNIYGTEKAKIAADLVAQVSDPQKDQFEQALLDPCGIEARIEKLQNEITEIQTELDFVLSEANARTEIEVEL